MARKIEVALVGDSRSLERAFGRSSKAGSTWGSKLKSAGKVAGLGIAAGIGIAAIALKKSVDAAKEAEVSQSKMKAQLKAVGISYEKFGDQIDKTIQKQSMLSAFDDEEMQDSFTGLVRVTGDVNKALKLNALAADVARGSNMDMATAGKLISKVAAGNTSLLKRYGIVVKDGATAQEALAAVQKKFGGQAEAYGKTTAGAQEKFGVALENVQEKIGQKLLPVLTKLFNWGIKLMAWAEDNWPRFSAAVQDAIDKVRPIFQSIVDYWNGTLLPTIESIVELARGFWGKFGDDITRVFNSVKDIVGLALNQVKAIIELVMAIIRGDWSEAWNKVKEIARNALDLLVTYLQLILTNILHAARALGMAILNGIADQAKKVPGRVWELVKQVPGKIRDLIKLARGAAYDLGSAILDGVKNGLIGLAGIVGGAVRGAINAAIDAFNALASFTIDPPGPGKITVDFPNIPHVDTGGHVARSGLAVIHKGEDVIPARGGNGSSGPGQFALVWAGPDFIRWMREQERRSRLGGALG